MIGVTLPSKKKLVKSYLRHLWLLQGLKSQLKIHMLSMCCFPLAEERNKRKTYFSHELGAGSQYAGGNGHEV